LKDLKRPNEAQPLFVFCAVLAIVIQTNECLQLYCFELTILLASIGIHFTDLFCNVDDMHVFSLTQLIASKLKTHKAKLNESSWLLFV
jgi:hypothetical protein